MEDPGDVEFYSEDKRASEDLEDLHSSKFRAEGQLMNYEEDPSFEGYLQVKVHCVILYKCTRELMEEEHRPRDKKTTPFCSFYT